MIERNRNASAGVAGRAAGVLAAALSLAVAAPVAADWLVTKDGARIETRGAWRVEGKRVLFGSPTGVLSMIRLEEVDLDKSAVATAEARASATTAATPPAEPRKEPVLVLTEKDIPPMGQAAAEEGAKAAADTAGSGLEVVSWEKTETAAGDGVDIFGTIRNNTPNMITSPTVFVAIYDADGGLLATTSGVVNSPQIAAGKTANFRASFGGLTDFAAAKFDVQGRGFKQRPDGAPGEEELREQDAEPPAEVPVEPEIDPGSPPAGDTA